MQNPCAIACEVIQTTFEAIQGHLAHVASQALFVFAAMAAPAPANLTSIQSRHVGAKGKPITTLFKPLDASKGGAAVNKQHDRTKEEAEEGKRQAEEQATAQPGT